MWVDKEGNSWISISEFNQQSYCEVQLKYKWEGIRIETKEMKKGSEVHGMKFQDFQEKTRDLEEVGVEEAIRRASENKERFSGREVFVMSPTFRIFGMIDAIEIGPEGILIIDDKPSKYAHLSEKTQTVAYALAFKDSFNPPMEIFVAVRDRDEGKIVWEDYLSQEWENSLLKLVYRMHDLALGKVEFEPSDSPKKCAACSFREICDKKKQI